MAKKQPQDPGAAYPGDMADVWGLCCRAGFELERGLVDACARAAELFPVSVARVLLSARRSAWDQVRWRDPPEPERYVRELHQLGERLLLLR